MAKDVIEIVLSTPAGREAVASLLAACGFQPLRTSESTFKQSLEQHCDSNPSYQVHSIIDKNPWDGAPVKCDMEAAGFKFDESWKLKD